MLGGGLLGRAGLAHAIHGESARTEGDGVVDRFAFFEGGSLHVADAESAAGLAAAVHIAGMEQIVMNQDNLAGLKLDKDDAVIGANSGRLGLAEEARGIGGIDETVLVAAGDDLDAAVGFRRGIHRGPDGELGIAIVLGPAVLMPGQEGSFVGGLVHEHGAVHRHGDISSMYADADVAKDRLLEVIQKQGIELEVLDFAVIEGRAFVAPGLGAGVLVGAGGAVELHQHFFIIDIRFSKHDLVDTILHFSQDDSIEFSDFEIAEFFIFGPLGISDRR